MRKFTKPALAFLIVVLVTAAVLGWVLLSLIGVV